MYQALIFVIAFTASYAGVRFYRRWSKQKGIVDVPNERSSHAAPTPRGGGLVIAAVCLSGYLPAAYGFGTRPSWGYLIGSLIIVTISWIDDVRSVSSLARFLCHSAAAVLVMWDAGAITLPGATGIFGNQVAGYIAVIATLLWIVWLVNAYNFMDGIDGIAGLQAVLAGIGWAVVAYGTGTPSIEYFGLIISAASLGFLVQNWQPAKIFMGDVGSVYLGYTFGVLPLLAARENAALSSHFAYAGLLVVWFFVFDSVLTLAVRLAQGDRVWQPHRKHLYQRLVRSGLSHARVSATYGVMTITVIAASLAAFFLSGRWTLLPLFVIGLVSAALAVFTFRKNLLT